MKTQTYIGSELEIFQYATNWKNYYRSKIAPFIVGSVLEVGAGIGATTKVLCPPGKTEPWICLEPDHSLAEVIDAKLVEGKLPACCKSEIGITNNLPSGRLFDTVIYIDVLEHIEDDQGELVRALTFLKSGGYLIVLSPAFQFLYSPFDKAIGHFRRYKRHQLEKIIPSGGKLKKSFYLDSVGFLLSAANRFFLESSMPTINQIRFWDSFVIPSSKILDPLLNKLVGRSVVAVLEKL